MDTAASCSSSEALNILVEDLRPPRQVESILDLSEKTRKNIEHGALTVSLIHSNITWLSKTHGFLKAISGKKDIPFNMKIILDFPLMANIPQPSRGAQSKLKSLKSDLEKDLLAIWTDEVTQLKIQKEQQLQSYSTNILAGLNASEDSSHAVNFWRLQSARPKEPPRKKQKSH